MNELIAGLILLLISGLSYLAMNHPAVYVKVVWKLFMYSSIIFILICVWNVLVMGSPYLFEDYIPTDKMKAAEAHAESYQIGSLLHLYIFVGIFFYLFLMTYFPSILKKRANRKEIDGEPRKRSNKKNKK